MHEKGIYNFIINMTSLMQQDNIEEIKKKAEKFESEYIKLKQEFKGYIESSRKNEEIKRQEMKTDLAKRLLAVADSLSRISESSSSVSCDIVRDCSENIKKNIDMVYSQLLSAAGLAPIDPAVGDRFDEQMHMAIGLEYSTAYPENSVFRVIRKGYRAGDNVVRPSEVIVSKSPVEVKVTIPGLWDRFLIWINPPKYRFAEISQKIDELERLQIEKLEKLAQDIDSLKNILIELEEKIELKERTPLQHDALSDAEQHQGDEALEDNKDY